MPKRSNEFQQLVFLIHRQLHDSATVTQSAIVADRVTGIPQEVDILIEARLGEYPFQIAVECVDYGRRANIEWVQQMRGKHQHRCDKLVLVSSSGFTANALHEADKHNIVAMSISEAATADWAVIAGSIQIARIDYEILRGYAVLAEQYGQSEDPSISADATVFGPDRHPIGEARAVAGAALNHPTARSYLFRRLMVDQALTHGSIEVPLREGSYLIDASRVPRMTTAIRIVFNVARRIVPIGLKSGSFGSTEVT